MGDERLIAMIADACVGAFATGGNVDALLGRHEIEEEDARAIRKNTARLKIYSRLVHHNISDVIAKFLPHTRARLNDCVDASASQERPFDADVRAFLADAGSRSHSLRHVPAEFLEWALPRWHKEAKIPSYMADLARFELSYFQVGAMEATQRDAVPQLMLDRELVFTGALAIFSFAFAVHELSENVDDREIPEERPTWLLMYRDEKHTVDAIEISCVAHSMLQRLFRDEALGAAIQNGCADCGETITPCLLDDTARLLAKLADLGLLLGSPRSAAARARKSL